MTLSLSAEMVREFEEEGVACPVDVLSPDEVAQVRRELDELQARLGAKLRRMDQCHLFFRWAFDLVNHPRVLDAVEDLLGPDLFVHSSRVFCKNPHDTAFVSWHQDGTYSGLNSRPGLSAWIALSESNRENGCVRVVLRSHLNEKRPHRETFAADNLLNHGEEICDAIDLAQVRDLVLRPGQMSMHHVNAVHGSEPSRSDVPRIGFAISYITPAVRHSHLPVVRARGAARGLDYDLVEAPPALGLDEAIAAQREFVATRGLQHAKLVP